MGLAISSVYNKPCGVFVLTCTIVCSHLIEIADNPEDRFVIATVKMIDSVFCDVSMVPMQQIQL